MHWGGKDINFDFGGEGGGYYFCVKYTPLGHLQIDREKKRERERKRDKQRERERERDKKRGRETKRQREKRERETKRDRVRFR